MEGIVHVADWISGFLLTSIIASIAVLVTRIAQKDEMEIPYVKVRINVRFAWIVFLCLTFFHAFLLYTYLKKCEEAVLASTASAGTSTLYADVVKKSGFPFFALQDTDIKVNPKTRRLERVTLDPSAPSTLFVFGGATILLVSLMPPLRSKSEGGAFPVIDGVRRKWFLATGKKLLALAVPILICVANWQIGSNYIAATVALRDRPTAIQFFSGMTLLNLLCPSGLSPDSLCFATPRV